jgi:rhodanese-related sulfurtransferase
MKEYVITPQELKELMQTSEALQLVDVRTAEKHQAFNIGGKLIPLDELPDHLNELERDKLVVTYCTSGGRSMNALMYLMSVGFTRVKSLDGGMTRWQQEL